MCASRLLGLGGDSLLMHLCGNLLEVGHRQKVGRGPRCGEIASAGLHGWLPEYLQNVSVLCT